MAGDKAEDQPKARYDTVGFIVIVELSYLLVLFVIALFYLTGLRNLLPFPLPDSFGPIPVGVPWFGALGGVIISLSGVVDHRHDWDSSLKYWHITRPFVGMALAVISVLIAMAGILSVGSKIPPQKGVADTSNLLYYLIAFVVGYREETFRELVKRLIDVILKPGGGTPGPVVRSIKPSGGSQGDQVTIAGSGFTGATRVKFGSALSTGFHVDSDSQITATVPPGDAGKVVSVTVIAKGGSDTGGEFTYADKLPPNG